MNRGQMSVGLVSRSVTGHEQSCAGTKYFTAVGVGALLESSGVNVAINPYISIMHKMSVCDWPSHRKSANTWSTKHMVKRPVSSSRLQAAAWRGF